MVRNPCLKKNDDINQFNMSKETNKQQSVRTFRLTLRVLCVRFEQLPKGCQSLFLNDT